MVFSFGTVRGGFGYSGSMSMNNMRNRKVYSGGETRIISGSGEISLSFASSGTWNADNRAQGPSTTYAFNDTNESYTIGSSGYNKGYVQIYVYIYVDRNYSINGPMAFVQKNDVNQVTIDDYYDKDLGSTFSYGPYNVNCNRGDVFKIIDNRSGISRVRMNITHYPQ